MGKRKVRSNIPTEEWYQTIENRLLKKQQDKDFLEALEQDKLNFKKLETENRLKKEREKFYTETKAYLETLDKDVLIKLRLNDKVATFYLSQDEKIETLIKATRCFLFELNLFEVEFVLVKDHPRLEIDLWSDRNIPIKNLSLGRMVLFHVKLK